MDILLHTCSTCKREKPLATGFHRDSTKKTGYSSQCKQCKESRKKITKQTPEGARKDAEKHRRYISNRNRKKRDYVTNLKESTPCSDCGVTYPSYVMDYDHISDQKNFNISVGVSSQYVSMAQLEAELALCELVCANCHRMRTHRRGYRRC